MHEIGLMQTALNIAFEHAARTGASHIHRIELRVGALSGVVSEALELAFLAATPGTLADGAELIVRETPVVCQCNACCRTFSPADIVYVCPECGDVNSCVLAGRELELASMEVS